MRSCALDESSISIERVNPRLDVGRWFLEMEIPYYPELRKEMSNLNVSHSQEKNAKLSLI